MPRAPYPLGGAAAAVVEDVARLGGFGDRRAPGFARESLRWTDADAPIDGIEWLNADSEWRDESRIRLWRAAAGYLFRPGPALTMLLDRPATLARWDRLTASRRVVGLAGLDAHGGIGRRAEDGNRSNIPGIPSYVASFNSFSLRVELERPWSGDAGADAKALFAAIRGGRVYSVIDGIARNGVLDFHAETAAGQTHSDGRGAAIRHHRDAGRARADAGVRARSFSCTTDTPSRRRPETSASRVERRRVVPSRGSGAWRAGRAARPVDRRQSDLLLAPRLLDAGGGAGRGAVAGCRGRLAY